MIGTVGSPCAKGEKQIGKTGGNVSASEPTLWRAHNQVEFVLYKKTWRHFEKWKKTSCDLSLQWIKRSAL